jgi:hypothetical protein
MQTRYHHCGEAASEKCLSAATFVRRRDTAARPAVKWYADVVTMHHRPPLLGSPFAVAVRDSELLDIARARATCPRTGAEHRCPGRANFKNDSFGIRIRLPACDLKDHCVIASSSALDYGYASANETIDDSGRQQKDSYRVASRR